MPRMGTVGSDLNRWPKSRAYQAWEESAPPNLNDAKIEIKFCKSMVARALRVHRR